MPPLFDMLKAIGIKVYGGDEDIVKYSKRMEFLPPTVDVVIVSIDLKFNMTKLAKAMTYVSKGAKYICTSNEKTFACDGMLCPNVGHIVATLS